MNFTALLSFLLSLLVVNAFNIDYPQYGGYGAIRRAVERDYAKMLPMKNRRSPLEGFEDISSMMRSIDEIQKPRFGRK
ncbi:hypothetical protein V3C99_005357 [Haemonchus contortus]